MPSASSAHKIKVVLLFLCVAVAIGAGISGYVENSSPIQVQASPAPAIPVPGASAPAEAEATAKDPGPLSHPWPPTRLETFPDLELRDLAGEPVRLSTFKGKVILFEFAGLGHPESIALAGGAATGGYKDLASTSEEPALRTQLQEVRVPLDHPDFVHVHVIFHGPSGASLEEAREWARHFRLDRRPYTQVLLADARLHADVGGRLGTLVLIDRSFTYLRESGKAFLRKSNIALLRVLARELKTAPPPQSTPRPRLTLPPVPMPAETTPDPLVKAFEAKQFKELERQLHALVAKGHSGTDPTDDHFSAAGILHVRYGPDDFDAWVAASPESFLPLYFRGRSHIHAGWNARGSGLAPTVTEQGWSVFRQELALADKDLKRSHALNPKLPYAATALILTARALEGPEADLERAFRAAVEADPTHHGAYEMMLEYLLPQWSGSPVAALEFALRCVAERPRQVSLATLPIRAHLKLARLSRDTASYMKGKVAEDCEGFLARLRKAYPKAETVLELDYLVTRYQGLPAGDVLRRYAESRNAEGMTVLGRALLVPSEGQKLGISWDADEGMRWLVEAGNAGHTRACGLIGQEAVLGNRFKKDRATAVAWFRKGASTSRLCQIYLADSYRLGWVEERDLPQAAAWYRKALGHSKEARTGLAEVLRERPDLRLPSDPR